MSSKKHFVAVAMAALALSAVTFSAADADARVRRSQGSVATQHGTVTGQSEVRRQEGTRQRSTVWTGPNGGQRTVEDTQSVNREAGTYNRDRTTTFNDGTTRTLDTDVQRTGEGTYSATRSVTGRNGETRTQTGDFAVQKTETGRVVTGDINTTNRGQIDYTREVSHQEGVRSVNSSATFEDGTSVSRASTGSCANGACSSSTTLTNRAGETTQIEQSRARTENGAVYSRDTTFSDGSTRAVDAERVGNGDGTGTVTRTVTGRDGETRTQTGTYSVTTGEE